MWRGARRSEFLSDLHDRAGPEWRGDLCRLHRDAWQSSDDYLVNKIVGTIWTSRLCRVEDEPVQLNALLLRALIDWADLATRHSPVALQAFQKGQELIIGFVSAGTAAI